MCLDCYDLKRFGHRCDICMGTENVKEVNDDEVNYLCMNCIERLEKDGNKIVLKDK